MFASNVFSWSILTYLHFSRVGKPILDSIIELLLLLKELTFKTLSCTPRKEPLCSEMHPLICPPYLASGRIPLVQLGQPLWLNAPSLDEMVGAHLYLPSPARRWATAVLTLKVVPIWRIHSVLPGEPCWRTGRNPQRCI